MADSDQPAAAAAATVSTNLGEALREARVAKDLAIEQIATELRIEARHLAAIEDNRFEQIGPPVFVKGYIRQYGQRLGLDPRALMEVYGRQTNVEDVQVRPTKPIKLRDERQITVWIVALLVFLLIAVGLAVWYLNGGEFKLAPGSARNLPASGDSESAAATEPVPTQPEPAATEIARADTPSDTSSDTRAAAIAIEQPRMMVAATPIAAAVSIAPAVAATGGGVSRGATPISLDLTFDSESWAEITDARGQKLFFELGAAGRHAVMRGEPPVSVTFGNGDAVRLAVDGERFAIPTQGRLGKLVRFTIGSDKE